LIDIAIVGYYGTVDWGGGGKIEIKAGFAYLERAILQFKSWAVVKAYPAEPNYPTHTCAARDKTKFNVFVCH
jgi:hypothetical protein